jgi:hypothetical protein
VYLRALPELRISHFVFRRYTTADMRYPHVAAVVLVALVLAGCATYAPLEIEPVRRTAAIAPRFSQSYYFFDQDQNLHFIMKADTTDQATGKPVTQIATIRVFWHPKGGVTTLNAAALNATFRYIVMTPDAVGMYEGAGFVRLNSADGKYKFTARVVDGDLRLTQSSASFSDALGRSHFRGYFTALYNDAVALDMLLAAHREFFARSLVTGPTTSPGPATAPSPESWGIPSTFGPAPGSPVPLPETAPATAPRAP